MNLQKNAKEYRKAVALVICALLMLSFPLCSYAEETGMDKLDDASVYIKNLFGEARLVCDVEDHPAYRNYSISRITGDLEKSYDATVLNYRNQYVTVAGKVTQVASDGEKLILTDVEGGGGELTVKTDDETIKQTTAALKTGDTVRAYGKLLVGTRFDKTVVLRADQVEKTTRTENISDSVYSFLSGVSFDRNAGEERSIAGKLSYAIPGGWKTVEEEISGIGMQGYLYRLNEIPATGKTEPEQAYVFYFDYETGLKYLSDRDERVSQIERAIISNILIYDSASDFPDRNITLENGQKLTYYDTSYQGGDSKIHNVEFIFSPGADGLACVMYVFHSSDHKEDIIYLLNTLRLQ